jgi:hypothetical protein
MFNQIQERTFLCIVGFEVLTAVVMKNAIFWDITPYSALKLKLKQSKRAANKAHRIIRIEAEGTCETNP